MFDAFIHIDAENPKWVYGWRLEAEVKLRAAKGSGMTDEQVKRFVDGCEYRSSSTLYRSEGSEADVTQITRHTSCTRIRFGKVSSAIEVDN
jgi:pantothenate kinase-related protein Tda10